MRESPIRLTPQVFDSPPTVRRNALGAACLPATWREKRDIVRTVSNQILHLRIRYAIDLIVHTKPMHRKFVEADSSFARQIMKEGSACHEEGNRPMAGIRRGCTALPPLRPEPP
jgi:hypothetical protein